MCTQHKDQAEAGASRPATAPLPVVTPQLVTGSRRRRLWELDSRAHCPVVGVCLPIPVLRRVVNKIFHGKNIDIDYQLHSGAVGECKSRTALAEGMQRELEQRYTVALQHAARIKTTDALTAWWVQASQKDLAGPLWATLTHPRCTPELAQQILGEVHMLQHQVGTAQRVEIKRMENLLDENAVLGRELARAQQRNTQLSSENVARLASQQGQIMQLRASLITRDTHLATLQEQLRKLEEAVPELACRYKQASELQLQADRIHALERALLLAQQENERQGRLMASQAAEFKRHPVQATEHDLNETNPPSPITHLEDRAVLCVGGRTASVPLYRNIIEGIGGRFTHHDGGEEESLTKLDTTLAAADLVICQTGCISHNAYWRVKDHCKRTGKQCVFVENTGTASLKRALSELQPTSMLQATALVVRGET